MICFAYSFFLGFTPLLLLYSVIGINSAPHEVEKIFALVNISNRYDFIWDAIKSRNRFGPILSGGNRSWKTSVLRNIQL